MSTDFHTLTISDLKRETADTVSIAFNIPAELSGKYQFKPGQYLTLRATINGEDVRRSYSICSTSADSDLRVAVKQVENGLFSTYANKDIAAGQQMDVMTPEGNFLVKNPESTDTFVFYAAGSGITPILSMIKSLLANNSQASIYLYYGNKSTGATIFKSELDALAASHSNFHITYFLSKEDTGNAMTSGRISADNAGHFYTQDLEDKKLEGIYSCGPQDMIENLKEFYTSKGLLHKFHFELFTATAKPKPAAEAGANVTASMTVIMDDEEFDFELKTSGASILQAAQDAGADVPFSCKGGVCCTCRAKVIEGTASMDMNFALEDDEVEQGFVLTCQAHPTSERVVVSFDEY